MKKGLKKASAGFLAGIILTTSLPLDALAKEETPETKAAIKAETTISPVAREQMRALPTGGSNTGEAGETPQTPQDPINPEDEALNISNEQLKYDLNIALMMLKKRKFKEFKKPILKSEMKYFTDLKLSISSKEDFQVLEHAINLKKLTLTPEEKIDFQGLSKLNSLENLEIRGTQYDWLTWIKKDEDLKELGQLKNLKSLTLNYTHLEEISGGNIENLESLDLSNNKITDISGLKNFKNIKSLQTLNLSNNKIADFSPIGNLPETVNKQIYPQTIELHLDPKEKTFPNPITDVHGKKLLVTNFDNKDLTQSEDRGTFTYTGQVPKDLLEPVKVSLRNDEYSDDMIRLHLYFDKESGEPGENVLTLDPLLEKGVKAGIGWELKKAGKITEEQRAAGDYPITKHNILYLRGLEVGYNAALNDALRDEKISTVSLEGLEYATNLKLFDMSGFEVTDLDCLPPSLTSIGLGAPGILPDDPKDSPYLKKKIDLSEYDFSFLAKMKNLKRLSLQGGNIEDISFLDQLKDVQLEGLYLDGNRIKDISVLADLKPIPSEGSRGIQVTGNRITDLSPLKKHNTRYNDYVDQTVELTPETNPFPNPFKEIEGGYKELSREDYGFRTIGDENEQIQIIQLPKEGDKIVDNNVPGYKKVTIDCSKIKKASEEKELKAAKDKLKEAITEAEKRKEEDYTKETWEVFANALKTANSEVTSDKATVASVTKAEETLQKAKENLQKAEDPEEPTEKKDLEFVVQGWQGDIFIERIFDPTITLWKGTQKTEENKVVNEEGNISRVWKLAPGEYTYKIESPNYKSEEGTLTVGEEAVEKLVNLQYTKEGNFPKITDFSLVDRATKRQLGTGIVEGDKIIVTVPKKEDRDLVYNGKSMIKATTENITSVEIWASASPWKNEAVHVGPYSAAILDGEQSWTAFYINPMGVSTLRLKGDTGIYREVTIVVREDDNQIPVLFDTASDGGPELGLLQVRGNTSIQDDFFEVHTIVQLVNKGEKAVDLVQYVKDKTGRSAMLEKWGGSFEGWYQSPDWRHAFDFEKTPITKTYVLYPKFTNSNTVGKYPKPFTVEISGGGISSTNGYDAKTHSIVELERKVDFTYGKEVPTQKVTGPRDLKVTKAGDPVTFKIDIKDPYALAYIYAEQRGINLPITQTDKGLRFTPGPSQDSEFFRRNTLRYGLMRKEYTNGKDFDIAKQRNIKVVTEGPVVGFNYINISQEDSKMYKGQSGYTIPFFVQGSPIEEVKVKTKSGKNVEIKDVTSEFKKNYGSKNYQFIMPEEDVVVTVKGALKGKEVDRTLNFKVVDKEGNAIKTDRIGKLSVYNPPYNYELTDITQPLEVKWRTSGTTYGYILDIKDLGTVAGKFTLGPKDGDFITLKVDTENMVMKKTKGEFEQLLEIAKEKSEQKDKYTADSLDVLKETIKQTQQMVKLQQEYTQAHALLADAIDRLVEKSPTPEPGENTVESARASLKKKINDYAKLKEKDYTKETWENFANALKNAKSEASFEKATVESLKKAEKALKNAYNQLEAVQEPEDKDLKDAKGKLDTAIKEAERLKKEDYTKETWEDFENALKNARSEAKFSKATVKSLEKAKKDLKYAQDKLKKIDTVAEEAEKINQDHKVLVRNSSYQNMTDIKSHWSRDFIKYCMDRGYLVGTSITSFSPDRPTTRAEFVTVLSRLAGIKEENYKKNKFTDVPKGVYYEAAVNWAQEKKIVEGTGSSRFAPDQTMTREEMATILDRYFQVTNKAYGNRGALYFKDQGEMSFWAADSVKRMTQAGILHGTDRNTFEPKSSFTRAELATVIYQLNK